MNSTMPRLAMFRSPSKVKARGAPVERHQVQRLLVHGALLPVAVAPLPGVGEDHAGVGARVVLDALLQEAGDGTLGAADRAVQQQHAPLGAVALGRRLEGVDE